jgi:N-acetylmuramoyl-L-alanine amidase
VSRRTAWQGVAPFSESQIDSLIQLITDIMARNHIRPENVLGHSDIAPQRKQDPGLLFPWKLMAAESIVPWLDEAIAAEKCLEYAAAVPDIA